MPEPLPLPLPKSRAEIRAIQSERKRIAFERAKKLPWYDGKLDKIDAARLDDPAEWEKIPVLDKDILRKLDHAEFMQQFCCVPHTEIAEFWRSGGSTGKPVFYPRTADDVTYGLLTWGRSFPCMGIGKGDLVPHLVPDRHPSGRPGLGAQRALVRCRHELGRRRQCRARPTCSST